MHLGPQQGTAPLWRRCRYGPFVAALHEGARDNLEVWHQTFLIFAQGNMQICALQVRRLCGGSGGGQPRQPGVGEGARAQGGGGAAARQAGGRGAAPVAAGQQAGRPLSQGRLQGTAHVLLWSVAADPTPPLRPSQTRTLSLLLNERGNPSHKLSSKVCARLLRMCHPWRHACAAVHTAAVTAAHTALSPASHRHWHYFPF